MDSTHAIVAATNPGAIYLGLAIATDRHGETLLYAADFAKGTIDVYNQSFQSVTTLPGNFTDPELAGRLPPFNIQAINNRLYVEYAPADDVLAGTAAPGEGAVDVYNADGQLQAAPDPPRQHPHQSAVGRRDGPLELRQLQQRSAGRQFRRRHHQRLRSQATASSSAS